jgi:hypothetical protein
LRRILDGHQLLHLQVKLVDSFYFFAAPSVAFEDTAPVGMKQRIVTCQPCELKLLESGKSLA